MSIFSHNMGLFFKSAAKQATFDTLRVLGTTIVGFGLMHVNEEASKKLHLSMDPFSMWSSTNHNPANHPHEDKLDSVKNKPM